MVLFLKPSNKPKKTMTFHIDAEALTKYTIKYIYILFGALNSIEFFLEAIFALKIRNNLSIFCHAYGLHMISYAFANLL